MKTLFLIIILIFIIGCENNQVVEPIVPQTIEKIKPRASFSYLQEFHSIEIFWQLEENNSILIKVINENLFNISNEYFITVTFENYQMTYYIGKPTQSIFIVPYVGNQNILEIKLFAIITQVGRY